MGFLYFSTTFIYLFLCLILSLVILMQESKSSGLGASFGGDPTQSIFGTSTADVLKKITGWLSFGFLFLALLLSIWTSHVGKETFVSLPMVEETSFEELP